MKLFILPFIAYFAANVDSRLETLANLGNLNYFIDTEASMNWTEALAHCKKGGLDPLTFETKEQVKFIGNHLHQNFFTRYFWTSARETRSSVGFVWDDDGRGRRNPNVNIFDGWYEIGNNVPYRYCVYIYPSDAKGLYMVTDYCETKHNVMCQKVH